MKCAQPTCETCKYAFEPIPGAVELECRRRAPVIGKHDSSLFPPVPHWCWCGEHEAKGKSDDD